MALETLLLQLCERRCAANILYYIDIKKRTPFPFHFTERKTHLFFFGLGALFLLVRALLFLRSCLLFFVLFVVFLPLSLFGRRFISRVVLKKHTGSTQ